MKQSVPIPTEKQEGEEIKITSLPLERVKIEKLDIEMTEEDKIIIQDRINKSVKADQKATYARFAQQLVEHFPQEREWLKKGIEENRYPSWDTLLQYASYTLQKALQEPESGRPNLNFRMVEELLLALNSLQDVYDRQFNDLFATPDFPFLLNDLSKRIPEWLDDGKQENVASSSTILKISDLESPLEEGALRETLRRLVTSYADAKDFVTAFDYLISAKILFPDITNDSDTSYERILTLLRDYIKDHDGDINKSNLGTLAGKGYILYGLRIIRAKDIKITKKGIEIIDGDAVKYENSEDVNEPELEF